MMTMTYPLLAMVALAQLLSGQSAVDQKPVIKLWPKGLPKDAKAIAPARVAALRSKQTAERITYVAEPTLTLYRASAGEANGCGIVICPGGGYNILAWPKEGLELARWFNSIGVTAVVLKYRVPRRDPVRPHWEPLQDAQRAIRIMRKRAADWGVDPGRIGILGFSAGGHLAFMAGIHHEQRTYDRVDDADDLSARPDFMCPIYAAYLGNELRDNRAEIGSLANIHGGHPRRQIPGSAGGNDAGRVQEGWRCGRGTYLLEGRAWLRDPAIAASGVDLAFTLAGLDARVRLATETEKVGCRAKACSSCGSGEDQRAASSAFMSRTRSASAMRS